MRQSDALLSFRGRYWMCLNNARLEHSQEALLHRLWQVVRRWAHTRLMQI